MLKKLVVIQILFLCLCSLSFTKDGYFPEDRPAIESLELLPPPPEMKIDNSNFKLDIDISTAYINDIDFITGKKIAPEIKNQAEADRVKTPEYIVSSFIKPIDDIPENIKNEIVKQTVNIIEKVSEDARNATNSAKDFYNRKRPCEYLNKKIPEAIKKCSKKDLKTGSYPSGHATRGMIAAYTLIEILPDEYRKQLFLRGVEFGDSRVILGVHWQSDVDASRRLALAVFKKLRENKQFQLDIKKAKGKLSTLN
ncbi:phosphatase PAP2 family protein [Candidatus Francisella endociliophora]|uniref:phosphatase PAP2 family protein n=1 Tax=Candidatus Francisella endociliophora TaxID=653937 RepID=UPI00069323C2|nr:phosphatase PAP2 family protein [Francisella sp. FSC1006]